MTRFPLLGTLRPGNRQALPLRLRNRYAKWRLRRSTGVTVLELGTYYAAPFAGALLADYGARVIKVESLEGEPMRTIMGFPESGAAKSLQGKQSISLDLASDEGRAIVHRLAAGADIVYAELPGRGGGPPRR